MGDVRCLWCEAVLPDDPAAGRRYCTPAHRQAAWRARRRWQRAASTRHALVTSGARLHAQIGENLAAIAAQSPLSAQAAHCAAVARLPALVDHLVRLAVLADRQAGASRLQIGASLGISGEAARGRYARRTASLRGVPGEPARR